MKRMMIVRSDRNYTILVRIWRCKTFSFKSILTLMKAKIKSLKTWEVLEIIEFEDVRLKFLIGVLKRT